MRHWQFQILKVGDSQSILKKLMKVTYFIDRQSLAISLKLYTRQKLKPSQTGKVLPLYKLLFNQGGKWDHFSLFAKGMKNAKNCLNMPLTCVMFEKFPEITSNAFGQVTLRFVISNKGVNTIIRQSWLLLWSELEF